jgi:uncharacterized membrane protein YhaH (DUF805 family)
MALGFLKLIRKYGLNAPPIYLAILGLFLVFIGAISENSALIDFGTIFVIIGFFLSIISIFIRRLRTKENG